MASVMRRVSPLLLYASLALAATYSPFFNIQLTTDASRRYMASAQMATGDAAQNFNFVLTTSTPFITVAGVGCSTCNNVPSYNPQGSSTFHSLENSANVTLVGNVSTSGTLIKENCTLHARDGSTWNYPDQTIIMSDRSSTYGGMASGLFGLAWGRATNNVSLIGGVFDRQPASPSVTYGLALQPPSAQASGNAGSLHWLGYDPSAFDGNISWKTTTIASDSNVATFEIDGWRLETRTSTVTNNTQDLTSAVDPYYVNMFFPSQDAQLIHLAIDATSSKLTNDGQSTVYAVPCNANFSLSTIIGGQLWQVDQTLLVQKQDDGTCVSNIQGWTDPNQKQYLFGSAFLSSLYVIVDVGNPTSNQGDRIGFARRTNPSSSPSIVGPIVGGVVGGVAGIAIISLAIFFWIHRRNQQKLRDILYPGNPIDNVGRFAGDKDTQPADAQLAGPAALSYASTPWTPVTSVFVEGDLRSPNVNDPLFPPSYEQTYRTGPSNPSQQQQPNPFPYHADTPYPASPPLRPLPTVPASDDRRPTSQTS